MLALIAAGVGFLGPMVPEVLKFFNRKADQAHELRMIQVQLEQAGKEHLWRMQEIESTADIAESRLLHAPMKSFGVQLLDAATAKEMSPWLIGPMMYLFTFLDLALGLVRPVVTYAAFGGYLFQKWARWEMIKTSTGDNFDWASATVNLWGEQDYAILTLVLGFWFGARTMKYAFGKKTR